MIDLKIDVGFGLSLLRLPITKVYSAPSVLLQLLGIEFCGLLCSSSLLSSLSCSSSLSSSSNSSSVLCESKSSLSSSSLSSSYLCI